MELEWDDILTRMLTRVPRCISGFRTKAIERPEQWEGIEHIASYRLACKCSCEYGRFLGYPLSLFNSQYQVPDFVGPLGFECSKCNQITEILDTNKHGYHPEACDSPSKYYGEGPRKSYQCANCDKNEFSVVTSFIYWDAAIEVVEEEPAVFAERAQDLFNEFADHVTCRQCGTISRCTDFGKL